MHRIFDAVMQVLLRRRRRGDEIEQLPEGQYVEMSSELKYGSAIGKRRTEVERWPAD